MRQSPSLSTRRPHRIGIAAGGRKDTPSIGQINGHHPFRRLHKVPQKRERATRSPRRRRARPSPACAAFRAATSNCDAPAEQKARDDPVLAGDACRHVAPGCSVSFTIARFCSSLKKRRVGRPSAPAARRQRRLSSCFRRRNP